MKTALKLATQRTGLPILNSVKVKDGQLYTTNLDIFIHDKAPDNVPDGLYHPHGMEAGIIVPFSDGEETDFPAVHDLGDFLGDIELNQSDLKDMQWVFKAASTETARFYINGIAFLNRDIVATDGHRLHKVEFKIPFPANPDFPQGMILPNETIKNILAMAKEKKEKSIRLSFYSKGFKAEIGTATIISKLIESAYPDYQRTIPADNETEKLDFNPEEILSILPQLKQMAKIAGIRTPFLKLTTDGKFVFKSGQVDQSWPSTLQPHVDIGFNALYLAALCAGKMQINDAAGPVKVRAGNKTAVLMPVRV